MILLFSTALVGQNIKFEHITDKDGLPQNVIFCTYQDSRGFMWFGTQSGLARYNGHDFTIYQNKKGDSTSISSNSIRSIIEDKKGRLWIGVRDGGVNEYDYVKNEFVNYRYSKDEEGLPTDDVLTLALDRDGRIWVGTNKYGVTIYNPEKKEFKTIKLHDDPELNVANTILFEGDFAYVGGDKNHLFRIDYTSYEVKTFTIDNVEKDYSIKKIVKAKFPGTIWCGTNSGGLKVFNTEVESFLGNGLSVADGLKSGVVSDLLTLEDGKLWIGTAEGLSIYDPYRSKIKNVIKSNDEFGLSAKKINCLFQDKSGSIWIGTEAGGINVFHKENQKFQHFKKDPQSKSSIAGNLVFSFLEDSDSLLWVGTYYEGITIIDRENETREILKKKDSKEVRAVLAMHEDRNNVVWIGYYGYGIELYDKKQKKVIRTIEAGENSISNNSVFCFEESNDGKIWIGSFGGIDIYDPETKSFKHLDEKDGLSNKIVTDITFDHNARYLWVGTLKGGVNRIWLTESGYKIEQYPKTGEEGGLSNNRINSLYEDEEGNLWVGTNNGLNFLEKGSKRFKQFFREDGLPDNYIYGILPDKEQNLWMSTNKGISKLIPVFPIDNDNFRNYGVDDGLQASEFNQGAYYRSPKTGELLFGGPNGYNSFFPEEINSNQNIPPVYLTSIKCFDVELDLDTNILLKEHVVLQPEQNYLSFEFVGLDYFYPMKNQYQYKLEGVDNDWLPATSRRYVSYPNLSGGEYVFKVRASNSDGIWNKEGTQLRVTIIPPFTETNLFYGLVIAFIGSMVWLVFYLKTRSVRRENKRLETTVAERTKELASKNKDITDSIQYAKRLQEAILPSLRKLENSYPNSFVIYKPKDIVSGDFYWFAKVRGKNVICAADCTGHGVPGAFMSMLGVNQFNSIVIQSEETQPDLILNELHQKVLQVLNQGDNDERVNDGMDLALVTIDEENKIIQFAGANNPLFVLRKSSRELEVFKGDKVPIGGGNRNEERSFTLREIPFEKGDQIFMFSDGFPDQFGGPKNKKFMIKNFKKHILETIDYTKEDQKEYLEQKFADWKGDEEQVDDVLVIGVEL